VFLNWSQPIDASNETVITYYRGQIASRLGSCFNPSEWEAQLRLALLGQCVRSFGLWLFNVHHHESAEVRQRFRARLTWWCEQARAGLEVLFTR
jgi:hypothetical protein